MKKQDRVKKGPVQEQSTSTIQIYETVEEAAEEAKRQAATTNVMPTAIMITAKDGHATGDGTIHRTIVDGVPAEAPVVVPEAPAGDERADEPVEPVKKAEAKKEPVKKDSAEG